VVPRFCLREVEAYLRCGIIGWGRPRGLLVDTLVAAGHPVVLLHPNVVKACRPRYRAAGGKSDLGDS